MPSKKFFVFIGLLLLGCAAIILILLNIRRQIAPAAPAPVVTKPDATPKPAAPTLSPEEMAKMSAQEAVRRLALMFAERFGTYSNQGDLTSLKELYPSLTDSMKVWLQNYVSGQLKLYSTDKAGYSGVTTRVVSSAFKTFDPAKGVAEMTLICQREQTGGGQAQSSVYYQNLDVSLKKVSDSWKVDSAYWEKK